MPITDWEALAKDAKEVSKGFTPAPADNYNMTIIEAKPDIAKNSGNQKFSATLVIDAGPYKGKRLWHDFTVTRDNKRGLSIFFQNMAVLGMPFEFFNANTADEAVVQNMVGKRISADLIVDEYDPQKPKNKIDKGWTIKAPTGPAELDVSTLGTGNNNNSGVPGGANNFTPPPAQYQQPTQPAQTNGAPPPQYAAPPTPPQQYQAGPPPQVNEDPWQTPQQAPPPPSNASWGAPPPAPPGLYPGS